jgi:hypothetical protein
MDTAVHVWTFLRRPCVQLVAGEQIDAVFGAKLGLTMMASAGLGNMVADVVGVSATHSVQEAIKRLNLGRPPRLRCGWRSGSGARCAHDPLCCCPALHPSPAACMLAIV